MVKLVGMVLKSKNNNVVSTGAHGKQPVESDCIFCQQCSKSFGTDKQFVGHINKIHSDMNMWCKSPKCRYLFLTRRAFCISYQNPQGSKIVSL